MMSISVTSSDILPFVGGLALGVLIGAILVLLAIPWHHQQPQHEPDDDSC